MKIYFAGSIRGGRNDAALYKKIIDYISNYGMVLTEHIGDIALSTLGEKGNKDKYIYIRDLQWLESADAVIAEVTTPSLGVGYELGIADKLNKKVLCLYRQKPGKKLSAMLTGNKSFNCRYYNNFKEIQSIIDDFLL